MQNTTAHPITTPAPVLAAGRYSWQRPGVLVNVALSSSGEVRADLYTAGAGVLPVEPATARAELLHTLAQGWPVEFTPEPAPAYLSRVRARAIHKQLGSIWNADERYAQASRLTGRQVESLTAITEEEARALLIAARAEQEARDTAAAQDSRSLDEQAQDWLR